MKRLIFTSLLMSFFALVVNAQNPTRIEVSDDTEVSALLNADVDNSYDVPKGNNDNFKAYHNDDPHWRNMGFLKFDLTPLAPVDPRKIESVKLKLYGEVPAGKTNHTIKVFNMTAFNPDFNWTENDLTVNTWKGTAALNSWTGSGSGGEYNYYYRRNPDNTYNSGGNNNNGKTRFYLAVRNDIAETTGSWFDWDITPILCYAGGSVSLQVCASTKVEELASTTGVKVSFHSKENTSGNAPYLEITYKDEDISRSVTAVADTYISHPTTYSDERGTAGDGVEPFGDDIEIIAMYNNSPTHSRRTLLKFNIPYNPTLVDEAQLYLYGKVSNTANGNSKLYDVAANAGNGTYHVYNMNYFMHNQTIFPPYVYDWNENIMFSDWVNGAENTSDMVLSAVNPFYSRRNPDDNQSSTAAGGRYGVSGTNVSNIGPTEVLDLDKYHWFRFNLDLLTNASILNFTDEPLSLQVCGKQTDGSTGMEYIPLYIHSKENPSGNAPQLQFKMKQSPLLLSNITIDGVSLAGFDPYITEYTVVIPNNAPVPVVAGTLKTQGAAISYTQATTSSWTATIEVGTGATLRYSIEFDRSGPSADSAPFFHDLDVRAVYSDMYAPADAGTSLTGATETTSDDNNVILATSASSGIVFNLPGSVDVSGMEALHFNIKCATATSNLTVGLYDGTSWQNAAIGTLATDTWYSKTIPLSKFNLGSSNITGVQVINPSGNLPADVYIDNVFFYTPSVVWSPQGTSNDWSDLNNWAYKKPTTSAGNYNVAIPESGTYPILTANETITTSINSIAFAPGAEIGNQDKLTLATDAYIKNKLASGRWHMLATPVSAGSLFDYYMGMNPDVWFRKFTPNGQSAGWTFMETYNNPLAHGEGFSYWIGGTTSTGATGTKIVTVKGPLATNSVTETIDFAAGGTDYDNSYFALAGNPFMTSIDFTKLRTSEKNTGIKENYLIYTKLSNGNGSSYGFQGYGTFGTWGAGAIDSESTTAQYIAPLQAFFVERAGASGDDVNLVFDLADAATGSGKLRTTEATVPKLDIMAENGTVPVLTFIAKSDDAQSARKLKNGAGSMPDIYTLAPDKATALGAQIIDTDNITVPLGMFTSYTGDITLTFTGMDTYENINIRLLDIANDTTVVLSGKSKTYTFAYTPQVTTGTDENGKETKTVVPTENSLFIAFSPKDITGTANTAHQHISVYYRENGVYAVSTATDLIKQVAVYDLQGRLIYADENINAPVYFVDMQRNNEKVFIVKLITEHDTKNVKVFVTK